MRRPLLVSCAVLVGALLPGAAWAKCANTIWCFCSQPAVIEEARVTALDGPRAVLEVTATHVNPNAWEPLDGGTPVTVTTLPRQSDDTVGRRYILFVTRDGAVEKQHAIREDGSVVCNSVFSMPAPAVLQAAQAADCEQQLVDAGFDQPPCRDTPLGCATSPGGEAVPAALLLLAATLALVSLQTRRTP